MGDTKKQQHTIDEEKRAFNSKWEEASFFFFFAEQGGKPHYVICLQVIGVSKEYDVNRHYNTLHKEKCDKYEGATILAMLCGLKSKLIKQR
jgi:hypothetical protein